MGHSKDWRRIEFLGIENNSAKTGEVNDSDGKYLQIAAALKNLDFLYIDRSLAYVPDFMKTFTCYGRLFLNN